MTTMNTTKIQSSLRKDFVLGGKAVFTLENSKTSRRLTYRVTKKENGNNDTIWLVNYKDGHRWKYVGMIVTRGKNVIFIHTKKSSYGYNERPFKSFNWFFGKLTKVLPDFIQVVHEGQCGRCGRQLTDPDSIKTGFGPHCRQLLSI